MPCAHVFLQGLFLGWLFLVAAGEAIGFSPQHFSFHLQLQASVILLVLRSLEFSTQSGCKLLEPESIDPQRCVLVVFLQEGVSGT